MASGDSRKQFCRDLVLCPSSYQAIVLKYEFYCKLNEN
jgi:hypothetical protein